MSRQEALAWLVENVAEWPMNGDEKRNMPTPNNVDDWFWLYVDNSRIDFFNAAAINDDSLAPITKSDWLAAIENKARGEA